MAQTSAGDQTALLLWSCQHDSGTECTPGESKSPDLKEKGNYIMYARATSGDKLHNNKFSICSIRNISQVLEKKRGNCFVGKFGGDGGCFAASLTSVLFNRRKCNGELLCGCIWVLSGTCTQSEDFISRLRPE